MRNVPGGYSSHCKLLGSPKMAFCSAQKPLHPAWLRRKALPLGPWYSRTSKSLPLPERPELVEAMPAHMLANSSSVWPAMLGTVTTGSSWPLWHSYSQSGCRFWRRCTSASCWSPRFVTLLDGQAVSVAERVLAEDETVRVDEDTARVDEEVELVEERELLDDERAHVPL